MKKSLLILITTLSILSHNAQSQPDREEKIRNKINAEVNNGLSKCRSGWDIVSNLNVKKEYWNICDLKDDKRIITIESYQLDINYIEIYFERNQDLIYAKESEIYMPINQFAQGVWNCEYYAKNGKLITHISLGHGKTETDEFKPEIIFEMYKTRLLELEKIRQLQN